MIKALRGHTPTVAPSARIAEGAVLAGDVTLEDEVNVWYGAVARGDMERIHVGAGSNLQDNCVLHCDINAPLIIGRDVTVGHSAILHGCTVEDGCIIGMGAILLNGCVIGAGSLVAAGALVTQNTVIPPGSMVMGAPAKVKRALTEEERAHCLESAREYRMLAEDLPPAGNCL